MFFIMAGHQFFMAESICSKCGRTWKFTVDNCLPPSTDLRLCPDCHPLFPKYKTNRFVCDAAGDVVIEMMAVDMRTSPLFKLQ